MTETKPNSSFLSQIQKYLVTAYTDFEKDLGANVKDIATHRFEIDLTNTEEQANIVKQLKKTGIFLGFILFSLFFILYAATDPTALTKNTYLYTLVIILPIIIGLYASTQFTKEGEGGQLTKILTLSVALIVFAAIAYIYSSASSSTLTLLNYFLMVLMFLMIVVGLALFYFVFSNYLKKQTGTLGYMINLVFYIPCLFGDFIKYMKNQVGITPSISYVLFVIEIILIMMYFYVPILMRTVINNRSHTLLNDPIFLNNEMTVASGEFFQLGPNEDLANPSSGIVFSRSQPSGQPTYRNSNYAVSFWVFVNPGSQSDAKYANAHNIFNYAQGKPLVQFQNDGHTHQSKYIITFTNNPDAKIVPYDVTLPHQKWHYFVFNYFSGKADMFVNGNLERTVVFDEPFNVPLNGTSSDNITVGQIGGLNGAICNVNYYTEVLPKTQIANYYNILMNSNPPIMVGENDNFTTRDGNGPNLQTTETSAPSMLLPEKENGNQ